MLRKIGIAFFCGLIVGLSPFLLLAQGSDQVQTPGITQELLVNSTLSQFPGKQITVFTGRFTPGAATPRHKHPGTELLYVLQGNGVMHIAGQDSANLSPGRAVLVQPEPGQDYFIHQAVNGSESNEMRTLVIVIHDAKSPPALPIDESSH
jgi:quercetin dioxygenase-like cupin family protein